MPSPFRSLRASVTALVICFSILSSQAILAQRATRTVQPPPQPTKQAAGQDQTGGAPPIGQVIDVAGEPLAPVTACGATGITITDGPTPPTPSTPYPYPITVAGITGNISALTVTITGLSHTFPDDVDMMLVAPDGTKMIIWSDVGGSTAATNVNITLDDAAAALLPDAGPLVSGTFRPSDVNATDPPFPAPAPAFVAADRAAPAGTATFTNHFVGKTPAQANGIWNLYIVDDLSGDGGSISGTVCLNIQQTVAPLSPGSLVISEFRLRGPSGANDEFEEIYNTTNLPITVADIGAGAGYGLVASDGTLRCTIPNGTIIPAGGHYLCANSVAYSLASYPAGNGTTATANATYTTDIPDNAGIALFQSTLAANFVVANRLDAVGSTSEANTLYKEGTGYPALTPFSIDYSFFRDMCGKGGSITTFGPCPLGTGKPKDTDNNAADFIFVDTNGTSAGAGQRLGAPGPENLSSPIQRNSTIPGNLLDTCAASTNPPNRLRDFTSDPANNSTFGTLDIRRTFTNNTGANVTRLRFRIVDITTFPAPSGTADLRARTSTDVVVTVDRPPCGSGTSNVTVRGTTLEQPPSQPNGGAFNSSLSAGTITLGTPLANGASVDVRFLLGIQQTGSFKFLINIEALP
ncbi:MAG: lamin tail domain-containing protein [Pyrinomonadaceae bacterium]